MIWTMKPTAKKLEDVETKVGNVGSTDLQSQVNSLISSKTNYLLIDATSYVYDTKEGWDYAYGQIPDSFGGFVKVNFQNLYTVVGTAYKQNSLWGSIIGHLNSNHTPFFYNVHSGTSTLDGVALNSNIQTLDSNIKTVSAASVTPTHSSINAIYVRKNCQVVSMRIDSNETGVNIQNNAVLGNIPVGYRPAMRTIIPIFFYSNGKQINGSLWLESGGSIEYYGDAITTKCISSASFITQ